MTVTLPSATIIATMPTRDKMVNAGQQTTTSTTAVTVITNKSINNQLQRRRNKQ